MNENAETLQKRLEDLEAGKPLTECLEGLEEAEAEMLQLAAAMRGFEAPARNPSIVEEQIKKLKHSSVRERGQNMENARNSIFQRNVWLAPALAATALVLFGCLLLAGLGFGGLTIARLDRFGNDPARVQEMQGIVEIQAKDGSWQMVKNKARLAPGTRVRTGELSSAAFELRDGSVLQMGSSTEITLDQMDRFLLGVRSVRITQWQGETSHEVQPNRKTGSLYEVRTPVSTVTARGTAFRVQVRADLLTRVHVTEGSVDVTGARGTISLAPGQTSSVAAGGPPEEPSLLVSGEGILTLSGERWAVAGETLTVNESTEMNGSPQAGDLISFQGRQLSDGTVFVERLDRIFLPETNAFTFSGEMQEIASASIVVAGRFIGINEQTGVARSVENGETVIVKGLIEPDGSWRATSVYSSTTGRPFQFVGVFQSSQGDTWMISGSEIIVSENTMIDPNILPGDVVEVTGWIQESGTWLAGSIQPVLDAVSSFDFVGTVESMNPWVISGRTVVIRPWTLVESGIQPGDLVHVQGPVLEDGTWVAAAIAFVDDVPAPEDVALEFTGIVNSTNPWVISGIQVLVDANTQLNGDIQIGALVKVRATLQPDGTWHADEISLVVPANTGCVTFASAVTAIDGDQLSLQNGMTINLAEADEVDGLIEVESVVLVTKCLAPDGTVTIPLIQVLTNPSSEPMPTVTATATATSTPAPVSVTLPNCYRITFLGFTDHGDGTSTWRYRVEELACAQDLSNWMLELPACAAVVDVSPSPWEMVQPDPNFGLNGIKWQTGAGFESGEFSVVLSGPLTSGVVHVGAKGPDVAIGQITGPACDVLTTGTPTVLITPTADITLTVPSLPTEPPPTTAPLPTQPGPPPSSGLILITDNNQTLTFTCNGNAVEVRGNANVITLLGSCSSIIVRGNANQVYWQSGSPVIINTGNENIITQR